MEKPHKFAQIRVRIFAALIDILIIGLGSFGLNTVNYENEKNVYIYLGVYLFALLYKPVLEAAGGATLGKMILQIKVTDTNFEEISFGKSLMRSLINMIPSLLLLPFMYMGFTDPELIQNESFLAFSQAVNQAYPIAFLITNAASLIGLADLITLIIDRGNKNRSIKDYIAQTYVIKN